MEKNIKKENTPSKLGLRIKEYIDAKNLSYAELERMAEVRTHTVRQLCSGLIQNTNFEVGCKIALALGVPPEELAGLTGREGFSIIDIAPDALEPRWFHMDGDYMEGTISNNENFLVDFGIREVTSPGVYLIDMDGANVVRRMAIKSGKLLLAVSNQEYAMLNEERNPADVHVVGKVIGKYEKI